MRWRVYIVRERRQLSANEQVPISSYPLARRQPPPIPTPTTSHDNPQTSQKANLILRSTSTRSSKRKRSICACKQSCAGRQTTMALDARAVDSKRADLDKAVKDAAPASTIIGILNDLKTGVVPSEKLLRETKIGVAVNKLRQFKDPSVAKLSTEIVNGWRTAMQKSKSAGGSTPKLANATNGSASPAPAAGSSVSPQKKKETESVEVKSEKKKYTGDIAKRDTKSDKVNIDITGNTTRDNCLKLMYNGLAFLSSERKDAPQYIYSSLTLIV